MDIAHLRTFVEVADAGGVSAAGYEDRSAGSGDPKTKG
jgi:hypothetical protein